MSVQAVAVGSVSSLGRFGPTPTAGRRGLTNVICDVGDLDLRRGSFLEAFHAGRRGFNATDVVGWGRELLADVRVQRGFARVAAPVLLTPPGANLKLGKGATPAYGLTLSSHAHSLVNGQAVNACRWAGQCTRVCVLKGGNGRYSSVQAARLSRSDFFGLYPLAALSLMGWELGHAVRRHGAVNFRPDVNSDLTWQDIVGDAFAYGLGDHVHTYGYTKDPALLDRDDAGRWGRYVRAYSWSERSEAAAVGAFLRRGGRVAIVSARRVGSAPEVGAVDADLSDEWILDPRAAGIVGSLSAKGAARQLIGRHGRSFVASSPLVRSLVALGGETVTHGACPVHSEQWFNRSTGDCSCGGRHR